MRSSWLHSPKAEPKSAEGKSRGNIFISYRREDSAAYAGRICDHLNALFGADQVFMDVEDISPGQNFAQAIDQTIAVCSAVLVIIGPRWMEIFRNRSEAHQQDYVRHEVEAALSHKATFIPVLVGGASMSQLSDLPPNLADLTYHQAVELRDTTFKDDCARLAKGLAGLKGLGVLQDRTARQKPFAWIGGFVGLVALVLALSIWVPLGPWNRHKQRKAQVQQFLNTARIQTEQAEYESALKSCQEAVKADPGEHSAIDCQLGVAMMWVEDFHVIEGPGQKAEELAGSLLQQIMPILDAGLARTNGQGPRAADIMAHIGWAHWLNQHIAYKEFGPVAEQTMRKALGLDPQNVYASAMLGNWLLQTHGSLDEALRHFEVAVKTGKQRALVRRMQLGGLISDSSPGVRTELVRVANQMRINSEPIPEPYKRRILSNYSAMNTWQELQETLSAVSPDDAWETFLWLNGKQGARAEQEEQRVQWNFIHASILEIAGKSGEALAMFRTVQQELKARGYNGRIADHVAGAIQRLSRLRSSPAGFAGPARQVGGLLCFPAQGGAA